MSGSALSARSSKKASYTATPEIASSATIILRRFKRSANTPPNGERTTVGTTAAARMLPNIAAEPVCSNTYIESENFSV